MKDNVERFFELYRSDPELRARVDAAEAAYPGSLEIRVPLVETVLLPIAEELGLGFTVKELRAYETRLKMDRLRDDAEIGGPEEEQVFWLLDRGWNTDKSRFKELGE